MKYLFQLSFVLLFCGCDKSVKLQEQEPPHRSYRMEGRSICVKTIEDCEYIILSHGGITHKANCTNHVSELFVKKIQNQ